MQCDVCKEDHLENLVRKTVAHFGQIDVLVRNTYIRSSRMFSNFDCIQFYCMLENSLCLLFLTR